MEEFPPGILQIRGNDIDKSDFNLDLYKASDRKQIFQVQEFYNVKKVVFQRINLDFYLEFF